MLSMSIVFLVLILSLPCLHCISIERLHPIEEDHASSGIEDTDDETNPKSHYKWGLLSLRPNAGCPNADMFPNEDELIRCPTPPKGNLLYWPCIRPNQMCNGIPDCPRGEDEHPAYCMFHLAEEQEVLAVKKLIATLFMRDQVGLERTSSFEPRTRQRKPRPYGRFWNR